MSTDTVTISVTANVDSENINNAITLLTQLSNSGVFKDYTATVTATVNYNKGAQGNPEDKEATVSYKIGSQDDPNDKFAIVNYKLGTQDAPKDKAAKVNYELGTQEAPKSKTVTVNYVDGTSPAAGTAHSSGSASGRAFSSGNWGIKGNGVALGGELGRELVVRNGRFFTIGDFGAEFFRYKKNDIIFNAAQTESLFKYGGIKGANPRGKMLASGTAFAGGSGYPSSGRAFNGEGNVSGGGTFWGTNNSVNSVTGQSYSSSNDSDSSSDTDSDTEDKFEEVFDWIEVILDRVERAIDKYEAQANNIYKSWSSRNKALLNQISEVNNEISLQQQAYNKYMSAANAVGLSSDWVNKIQNGSIDISTVTDETLAEKINDYKEWYEKALDCQDAIEELKEKESELYAQRVENVATKYEGILGVIEHEKNMLEEYINQSETQGWLVSYEYYRALSSNEKKNIAELEKQKAEMLAELQVAMNSGTIEKYSEGWYELVNSIDEVSLSIAEANTKVMEISQTAQQLKWEVFDLLQDKISTVTEEAEFLIELLSSDKLYDDNGQLTNSGVATMGQHGVAYNTYMHQAELAREEAERIKAEIESGLYGGTDKYDTELEERYREMIALQQEHILAAEGEKEAIRDIVEEGIQLELDALSERIDKYNEALESQKDLYDYQKKVKEQTEEIASLEKQIAAYRGDISEEAKAKIQELKVTLEDARDNLKETEYERYISDQQKLLDELYLEYETILNTRLDNIDALISDMIIEINEDASIISDTIREAADSVGYTLSDSMQTIWSNNANSTNDVITMYGEKFSSAQTTTNNALNTINSNLQSMIAKLDAIAKENAESASTSSSANSSQANSSQSNNTQSNTTNKTPSTGGGSYGGNSSSGSEITVGGKINAAGAPIYDYAGDTSGESQYFGSDPIYTVIKEQDGYLLVRYHKLSSGYTGWFKKSDVKAYASGARRINSDDMAWTQEKGREFIVRPSDGAILTPVANGDSVLNATASSNIWDMANSPAEFIRDNLKFNSANVPNGSNIESNYTQYLDKVVFNFPNVKNYEELLSSMQKDKNFERLISSMTVDRLVGKSALAKGKSIR